MTAKLVSAGCTINSPARRNKTNWLFRFIKRLVSRFMFGWLLNGSLNEVAAKENPWESQTGRDKIRDKHV